MRCSEQLLKESDAAIQKCVISALKIRIRSMNPISFQCHMMALSEVRILQANCLELIPTTQWVHPIMELLCLFIIDHETVTAQQGITLHLCPSFHMSLSLLYILAILGLHLPQLSICTWSLHQALFPGERGLRPYNIIFTSYNNL